jgi:hypothetical protein
MGRDGSVLVPAGPSLRSQARVTLGMMSEAHADAIQALALRLKAMLWRLQR